MRVLAENRWPWRLHATYDETIDRALDVFEKVTRLYPPANRLDRETALRLWTERNTWFGNDEGTKGQIAAGQLADLTLPRTTSRCPRRTSSIPAPS